LLNNGSASTFTRQRIDAVKEELLEVVRCIMGWEVKRNTFALPSFLLDLEAKLMLDKEKKQYMPV
jgi:hypothetical protein